MVSAIIPHWPFNDDINEKLKRCVSTLVGYDELIIVSNEGTGYGKNVNIGLKLARYDFLCVINNDSYVVKGTLKDLCRGDGVAVPVFKGGAVDRKPRAFFCMPRWVYERVGGYDERFEKGYFEDDDLIKRLEGEGIPIIPVDSVVVNHEEAGTTMHTLDRNKLYEENRRRFNEKWKSQ